jgi:succinate CoA transferase
MALTRMTAAEAAALIKNGENIALSGFTPAGVAKAVTKELAKCAEAEHAAGREFQVGVFTGASTGQSTDGDLANAHAIKYRAPYTTNPDFRKHVNAGEIAYDDLHLSHMAQELRYGFMGQVDWAILEVCEIEECGDTCKVYLTAAGGISPTAARLAKHVVLELNTFHNPNAKFIHDVYEPLDPPYRKPIPIVNVGDRIGKPYVEIETKKIVGVVECNIPDEARAFKSNDPVTDKIGFYVAEFLVNDMKRGIIPQTFLPLQSGVGSTANAILGALGKDKNVPDFNIYTEVIQNSVIGMMLDGRVKDASACSLTVSNECLMQVYDNMDYFKQHLTLRQSEISNSPEVIRRLGVIAINTAIECDIYGNANSTHISGTRMMNGIGGSGDFERNAYISIFTCPSTAKGGNISSIVPFVSHQDHSEHDVNIIVTEQGVADLRGKSPMQRAQCIIENCAHPDYKQLLWDYLKIAKGGQTHHYLPAAFAMHDTLGRKGDMRLTDFSEYVKE